MKLDKIPKAPSGGSAPAASSSPSSSSSPSASSSSGSGFRAAQVFDVRIYSYQYEVLLQRIDDLFVVCYFSR